MHNMLLFCCVAHNSDNRFNPPMDGPDGLLIPLRNNAAGKMTGLEVITKSLITEYFPKDRRSKGYNVRFELYLYFCMISIGT